MTRLTRSELTVIKCCIQAEIRLQEETLKEYEGDGLLNETARADAKIEIDRLTVILGKLNTIDRGQRIGTNLSQNNYERLAHSAYREFSETEIKAIINREFGFEFSQIELVGQVETWELDETGKRWERQAKYDRKPLYEATDWNYIRFNVRGNQYEFIDGELYFYED